jgi:hypothetical protein
MQIKKVMRYLVVSAFSVLIMMSCSEDKSTSQPNSKQLDVATKKDTALQLLSIKTLPFPHSYVISDSVFSFSELITAHFMDSIVDKEYMVYYQLKSGNYLPLQLGAMPKFDFVIPPPTCRIQVFAPDKFLTGMEDTLLSTLDFAAFLEYHKTSLVHYRLVFEDGYFSAFHWGSLFEELVFAFDQFVAINPDFKKIPVIGIDHEFTNVPPILPPPVD